MTKVTKKTSDWEAELKRFTLDQSGLCCEYDFKGTRHITCFDPLTTCDLLKRLVLIDGFNFNEATGHITVLTEKDQDDGNGDWATVPALETWEVFVTRYALCHVYAEAVCTLHEGDKSDERFQRNLIGTTLLNAQTRA